MIAGTMALAIAGIYGFSRKSVPNTQAEVCKEQENPKKEKMIRGAVPMWENITKHLIKVY
jgi:hypothetical protein